MIIKPDSKIQDFYNQFVTQFPYLKIEFYKHDHAYHQGSPKSEQWAHDVRLGSINPSITTFEWKIDPDMSVGDFEKWLKENLGMHVQVFRKSNQIWLQTTATDDWSLSKQNGKGERSTLELYADNDDTIDYF